MLIPQQSLRVPTSEFTAPQVAPMRNAAGEQIEQLGGALQSTGSQVARVGAELQERAHLANVKTAQARSEEMIAEADDGYINTIGADAVGGTRELARKELQKQLADVEKGLEHEVERRILREVIRRRMLALGSRWGRHEAKETLVYEIGAGTAALGAKKNTARMQDPGAPVGAPLPPEVPEGAQPSIGPGADATGGAGAPGEPGVAEARALAAQLGLGAAETEALVRAPGAPGVAPATNMDSVRAEAESLAGKYRMGPGEAEAFVLGHVTDVHVDFVKDLLSEGRGTEAREYLEGIKAGDITPDGRQELQVRVRNASLQDESGRLEIKLDRELFIPPPEPVAVGEAGAEPLFRVNPEVLSGTTLMQRWQIEGATGETRAELVSTAEWEFRMTAELTRLYDTGKISIELRDLTTDRVKRTAAGKRRQTAERSNETLNKIEEWGVQNRGASLSDMPPELYHDAEKYGLLAPVIRFFRDGRHFNDAQAVEQFYQHSDAQLRELSAPELFGRLRTQMDTATLARAKAHYENAFDPGANLGVGITTRILDEAFTQLGRPGSQLELRAVDAGHDTGGAGARRLFGDSSKPLTAAQVEARNRFRIAYEEEINVLRAAGTNITMDIARGAVETLMITERVNVESTGFLGFGTDYLGGVPLAALTGPQIERALTPIDGEDFSLGGIPGRARRIAGLPDTREFEEGDVHGRLIELAQPGRTSPRDLALQFQFYGEPRNRTELNVAWEAATEVGGADVLYDPDVTLTVRQEAAAAARRAIHERGMSAAELAGSRWREFVESTRGRR